MYVRTYVCMYIIMSMWGGISNICPHFPPGNFIWATNLYFIMVCFMTCYLRAYIIIVIPNSYIPTDENNPLHRKSKIYVS